MSPLSPAKHAAPKDREPGKTPTARRPGLIGLLALVVVGVLVAVTVTVWQHSGGGAVSGSAVATASSTRAGYPERGLTDSGSAGSPGADWRSDGQAVGSWFELSWRQPQLVRRVVIVRNPLDEPGVTAGFLSFGDGSYLQVTLSDTERATVVPVTPRTVGTLRFTASAVSRGTDDLTISEVLVSGERGDGDVVSDDSDGGNAAGQAAVSARSGAADPRALRDGSGVAGSAGAGADWSVDSPAGAWAQLDWTRPRELSSVEIVGSAQPGATVSRATLTFGDGTRLPVGGVVASPDRPTVVSFMPRVTTSLRLTVDQASGSGPLHLGELRTYERGATPVRSPAAATAPPAAAAAACLPASPPEQVTELLVRCPVSGSTVDASADFQVSVPPGYGQVVATVWPADDAQPEGPRVTAAPDATGAATLTVDLGSAPPGPLTVKFAATGDGRDDLATYFQLYRRGGGAAHQVASSPLAGGRTLAYAEEFDRPLATSRTGAGADYATGKPVHDGAQDFGGAIFADPAQGLDNMRVVDDSYLRIDVAPTPPGYPDPQGWGRTHVGGLLASARQGGSGFAAQYGYFEARMLGPAAPGTWPAFWMLPSDNLAAPTPVVAEVDAIELYGHDPQGGCQSTHQYKPGDNDGSAQCGQQFPTDRAALAWHTYGVSITPTEIVFSIDGRVTATAPQVEGGDKPMFFLVDLALGGGWPVKLAPVQDRATLYVDYVRVYV